MKVVISPEQICIDESLCHFSSFVSDIETTLCLLTVFTLLEKGTNTVKSDSRDKRQEGNGVQKNKKESEGLVLQVFGGGAVKEIGHACGTKEAQET